MTNLGRAHTGGSRSRVQQCMFENTLCHWCESTPSRLLLSSCRSVRAILCVLQPGLTSVALLEKGKGAGIIIILLTVAAPITRPVLLRKLSGEFFGGLSTVTATSVR
ncbi:hypothetical protein PoB_007002300 [Plakobranchus ocellatus]|uniref:Uncharacterized protein n=1 Tax=Plakobranchus ocellatus TaxID=259542 RepID=A0AAV4DGU3_9GAST|nr:hypothetical protein PoB_007002300 [Plakobranchus ocellatus]